MKYRAITSGLFLVLMIVTLPTLAQTSKVRTLTLDECLNLAEEHNVERKASQLRMEAAQLRKQSAQNSYLPTISLGIGQSIDLGRSQDKTGVLVDRSSASSSLSLSMHTTLFSGLKRVYEGRIASHAVSRAEAEDEQARFELRLRTLQHYYNWMLAVEMEHNQRARRRLLQEQCDYAKAMFKEGRWAKNKLVEAEASLLASAQALNEAESAVRIAKLDLLQHINLEEGDSLYVELTPIDTSLPLPDRAKGKRAYLQTLALIPYLQEDLPSVRALAIGQEGARLGIALARTGYMPRVSLSAGYSNGYYYQFGEQYRAFNLSFSDQWRQNGRSYIGLSLGWNIFDAFATRTAIRSAKLDYRLMEVERERAQKQIVRQGRQLGEEMRLSQEQVQASKAAYDASWSAYWGQKLSYNEGRSSSYELEEAIARLHTARSDLSKARINYLLRLQMLSEYEQACVGAGRLFMMID